MILDELDKKIIRFLSAAYIYAMYVSTRGIARHLDIRVKNARKRLKALEKAGKVKSRKRQFPDSSRDKYQLEWSLIV